MKLRRKKVPKRMCLGCRQMIPKKDLTRIVRLSDGNIEIDTTGKKSGRGAYVCSEPDCRKKALKAECLAKALNTKISQEVILYIKEELEK